MSGFKHEIILLFCVQTTKMQRYSFKNISAIHRITNKNSSGDEIENVNFFTTLSPTYFKIPKKENLGAYFV